MKTATHLAGSGPVTPETRERRPRLEIVVPVTSIASAKAAIAAAGRLGTGLDTTIRLLKIQLVPFPLQMDQSPIADGFLEDQLRELDALDIHVVREIRYARDFDVCLRQAITKRSLVVLAGARRIWRPNLWRTREERLAKALTAEGYSVVLIPC